MAPTRSVFDAGVGAHYVLILLFGAMMDTIVQILVLFLFAVEDPNYKFLKYFSIIVCAGLGYYSIFFCLKYVEKAAYRAAIALLTFAKIAMSAVFIWWYPQISIGLPLVAYSFIALPSLLSSIALLVYAAFYHRLQKYMPRRITPAEYVRSLLAGADRPVEYSARFGIGQIMTVFVIYMLSIYSSSIISYYLGLYAEQQSTDWRMFMTVMAITAPAAGIIYGWVQVYFTVQNYARHMRALRRGKLQKKYGMNDAINYVGYQVVYAVFSTTIIIFTYVTVSYLAYMLILLDAIWEFVWNVLLARFIGVPFITFIVAGTARRMIGKYVFSADGYNPRYPRWFEFFEYILVFVNILLAAFAYLGMRVLRPIAIIIFLSQRMDRRTSGTDFGYRAYYSVLVADGEKNNMVMRAFVDLLWQSMPRRLSSDWILEDAIELEYKIKRARLRWLKAYTLVRNPQLIRAMVLIKSNAS